MNTQNFELELIRGDTDDLQKVLLALTNHELAGYLFLALSPTIGFVTEESHNYLLTRNLINDSSALFTNYKKAVKKSRALLKLFDDTDGGMDGLIELLNLFQDKSNLWMNTGRRGLFGFLVKKWLQPDSGIYFLDEDPIYMSIVGFSAGKTKQEILVLSEGDFKGFPEQARAYGIAVGEYFATLEIVMNYYGVSRKPEIANGASLDFKVTHNDFHSSELYQFIAKKANLELRLAPAVLFILSQVNIAHTLLPRLLSSDSNLLARLQFLTAYHATRSLSKIQQNTDDRLSSLILGKSVLSVVPNIKKVRNIMAHYGLGDGEKFIRGNSDVLGDVVRGFCKMSKPELLEISREQLEKISAWTCEKFSKTQLKVIRALLGDHT